jgi:hypothetical protein
MPCSVRVVVGAGEPVARLGSFWKLADDEVGLEKIPTLHDCFICSLAFAAYGASHSTMFYILLHDMCTPSLCSLASHGELRITSSTAQGGGGSFKNRKPIGEIGCCESRMAERIH